MINKDFLKEFIEDTSNKLKEILSEKGLVKNEDIELNPKYGKEVQNFFYIGAHAKKQYIYGLYWCITSTLFNKVNDFIFIDIGEIDGLKHYEGNIYGQVSEFFITVNKIKLYVHIYYDYSSMEFTTTVELKERNTIEEEFI